MKTINKWPRVPEKKLPNDNMVDDLKWWEVFCAAIFVFALYILVSIGEWFTNPIKRGLFVSALIGFILSVALILFTAMMWAL